MKRLWPIALLVLLPSCQSPQQQASIQQSDQQYCQSIGATGNVFAQCMMNRDQARRDERQRRSQAFLAAGAQLNTLAAQQTVQPPKVVTTNCTRDGYGNVSCQSF